MAENKLLSLIRDGGEISLRKQIWLTLQLSAPAIMAQLSVIVMQYIDAAMVGHLGAEPAAAGLRASASPRKVAFRRLHGSVWVSGRCGSRWQVGAVVDLRAGHLHVILRLLRSRYTSLRT